MHEYFSDEEKSKIAEAWNLLVRLSDGKTRSCGTPYYLHPLRVANILAQSRLDCDTIICAILHSIHEFNVSSEELEKQFGENTNKIINTANKILNLPINTKTLNQSDAIRNMLFAMCDDARIILLTLADRLDRIRNLKSFTKEEQHEIAKSVIEIWAPLADRLGMQAEKNEFEDLSLKYINPQVFLQIKAIVAQKKDERSAYLEKAVNSIYKSAEKMGIPVEIQSRAKHFYSIYQKMKKRNKEAGELFDLLALRILCDTPAQCYTLVGIVHGLWKPLDGRFKDYIAMPKSNGYQSLHTTVMCEGKPLEIQIRTREMHNMAEHGIASHWLYKKGMSRELVEEDRLEIYNKLQKFKQGLIEGNSFETLKNELLGDEIYVFTPRGDVKKLPLGANAIDFAYAVHSSIGEKVIAAKADGKIIPLSKPLENTQIIEVITNPQAHPTENQLKLVKTSKARQKIHSWLMKNDPTFSERLALAQMSQAGENGAAGTGGGGGIGSSGNTAAGGANLNGAGTGTEVWTPGTQSGKRRKKRPSNADRAAAEAQSRPKKNVLVQGERNVLYNLAQCCHPQYPDLIAGYVTRTKGVSVHRADCLTYQRIPHKEERSVQVEWDTKN
ncbi:MAG: bifunctional (p)ppGpp synthetase/guanosine-3',5'-bis(diphosphate) 3'-pyrophosphohydrolase [Treponema sp.]|nr:bifunctional (p)ppGpp synthetase/guanosine-3',5'-bis(diphosphate) 3'-pyrophosphohydrolase [Treponema sp.]